MHIIYIYIRIYIGLSPCPVAVTTRIIFFSRGFQPKPSFVTGILGGVDNPTYNTILYYIILFYNYIILYYIIIYYLYIFKKSMDHSILSKVQKPQSHLATENHSLTSESLWVLLWISGKNAEKAGGKHVFLGN